MNDDDNNNNNNNNDNNNNNIIRNFNELWQEAFSEEFQRWGAFAG
jgi:hypothetical protein